MGGARRPGRRVIVLVFQPLSATVGILDSAGPRQYGPRGFGGWRGTYGFCLSFAGVESMADGARENGKESRPTDDAALSARLQRLGERLDHVGASRPPDRDPAPRPTGDPSALARGFRLSTELVGGVIVGAVLGWFIDRVLGISPWGLIVFLLLGFVAGVLNVMRAAGAGAPDGRAKD